MRKFIIWGVIIILFEIFCTVTNVPDYLFPKPSLIVKTIYEEHSLLLVHTWKFLIELFFGFILSIIVGYLLALGILSSKLIDDIISPPIVVIQTIPKIILGPFLLIWLGFGLFPKIVFSVLLGFLPILLNSLEGLKNVNQDIQDVFKIYSKSKKDYLLKIQIPNSIPHFFLGLRISIPFIFSGVIVGEWLIGSEGLAYVVFSSAAAINTPLAISGVVCISIICLILFNIVKRIERKICGR